MNGTKARQTEATFKQYQLIEQIYNKCESMKKEESYTDAKNREVYVAMTRVKNNLYIHCSNNCFDGMKVDDVIKVLDDAEYFEPNEIIFPVSHRGVA